MTRQIVVTQNITLDGVIEATGGWFEPEDGAEDTADILASLTEQTENEVGFLVGRATFEEMRGYWRHREDDATGIGAHLDRVDKFAVSSTLTDPGWENTTVLRGGEGLADDIAGVLKEGPDGDISVTGSIELCHALFGAGLVDELRLFVYPLVLGRGRGLTPEGVELRGLRLTASQSFRSGVTLQTYRLR